MSHLEEGISRTGEVRHPCQAASRILLLLILLLAVLLVWPATALAGGPRWVAGSSYFNTAVKGQPIVWSGGKVSYYTDLGALSSQVNQTQANTMVANAAAVWNGVTTAALSLQRGGSLAEDVSGANVTAGATGPSLPSDILPGATARPVAVIYDQDGSVIDTLYGTGASSPLACENDGVFSSVDNFTVSGNIAHALIVVNGLCAGTTAQIATLQYQLVRAFGRVLGLDWSQANEQMFVGSQITTNGLLGWPIMHPIERLCSSTSGGCIPNATQLRTDDLAALNRLYPVTAANIGSFTGKTITASATISVRGTIQFGRGQGMQGINVVLRPLTSNVPDIRYTVAAVSGAYFRGNAGNPVNGPVDAQGNPLNRFGSDDPGLEGYFDLSGVPLPAGATSADYQLTFEPVNPLYIGNASVGPYTTGQVTPSGTLPVLDLGILAAGSIVTRDIVISDAAEEVQSGADGTESSPAEVPASGEWTGRVTGYGHTAWFEFRAQGSREFTVEAQPLDEKGSGTEDKAQLVIGAWNGSDAPGELPVTGTTQPFNGQTPGLTTLPVLAVADSEVRIGLADYRGDGRPDFAWRGRILYADSVSPSRLPSGGGQIVIRGMGFRTPLVVSVNGLPAQVVSVTPNTIVATAPASGGATGDVVLMIQDAKTLGVAAIADGLSYDAQGDDAISIVTAPMNSVPIGVPQPFTVRTINVGTGNPASGVAVKFSVTQGSALLGCGLNTCSITTAGDGTATLTVIASSVNLAQIAASLSSGSSVLAEFTGTTPPSIAALTPDLYLALGATAQWPIQAMVLSGAGSGVAGQNITWSAVSTGLSPAASQNASNSSGMASNQVVAGPFSSSLGATVNACLTGTTTCTAFEVVPVHPETAVLSTWSGAVQYMRASDSFAPVVLRVMDAFGHPLAGARVTVAQAYLGWTETCPTAGRCPPAPLLAQQTVEVVSGLDGLASVIPLATGGQAGRLMMTAATAGNFLLNLELDAHP